MNFFEPTQFNYYNDMVEIAGDVALYDAYVEYLHAMQAQVRSDDHFVVRSGDDGRTTMFPSPRRQADLSTDDTIVDRMDEIDCSEGGSPSGRGLIRIANMAFRSARAVIMHKLVELHRDGCDIDVDREHRRRRHHRRARARPACPCTRSSSARPPTRPQVIVHDKFWLVDAKQHAHAAERTKVAYAGSSNWRDDQQRSDDLLLRIVDDGVHADYLAYWEKIRSRAASDLPRTGADTTPARDGARGRAGTRRERVGTRTDVDRQDRRQRRPSSPARAGSTGCTSRRRARNPVRSTFPASATATTCRS